MSPMPAPLPSRWDTANVRCQEIGAGTTSGSVIIMALSDKIYHQAARVGRRLGLIEKDRYKIGKTINPKIPEEERCLTPMHRAFYENAGSVVHKWRHYLSIYDRHLSRYRGTQVRFLELGVYRGGSLRMWRKYFGDSAIIFGIDIDESCRRYNGEAGQVRIGSQDDPKFLKSVVDEMGGIDVVLDDGSHVASHQKASFDILFPLVSSRGTYICEDTHTAYWRGTHEGGYRRGTTFIERAKLLIDDLHGEFHRRSLSVPDAYRVISGVHFYNSIVVIEKSPQEPSIDIKIGTEDQSPHA
jgi:Methyltransferase domain